MKFVGLRLCEHDSNISYFDGNEVFYFKLDRFNRIKHSAYNNFESWVEEIEKMWKVSVDELDEIGIVFDPWHYKLDFKNDSFFPSKNFDYLPFKVTRINHHYAHALSCWPLVNNCNTHFVFDAFGDYNITWSVFKNKKLMDVGHRDKQGSLGLSINTAAEKLGIEAKDDLSSIDLAGKLMGLQSYGKLNTSFLEKLSSFTIKEINLIFNFGLWEQHMGDSLLAELNKLDWIHTVHHHIGETLVEYFSSFVDHPNDIISYSGGCAQNVVWNTTLKNKFKNLVIPPHCADEGLSLGVLEFFRIKHSLECFKTEDFPYWQEQRVRRGPA